MAWGYWSATTVSDRGRSPRRNKENQQNHHVTQSMPKPIEERPPSISQTVSNNPQITQLTEFEEITTNQQLSRRPSLDLGTVGPQSALAGILCAAHGSRQQGGTLSAGNTLTRVGSRHTAVEYAVPHHFHHHHHHAYVEYHQTTQLSFSDDDSSSEPGYDSIRTGRGE